MKGIDFVKKWWLIGAAVLGVMLILLPRFLPDGKKESQAEGIGSSDPSYYSTICLLYTSPSPRDM